MRLEDGWYQTTVGESAKFLTGFPFTSEHFSSSGVRLVRGSNVKRACLDWGTDITKCWPKSDSHLRPFELADGDIVVAMDGALVGHSYARIAKRDLPAYLVQRVARLRASSIEQGLLYAWIGSDRFVKHVDSVKTHTAIPHISPRDIRQFSVVVPVERQEQRRISEALADADALIDSLERLIAKKQAIKQGMLQQLLTGRTRLPGFDAVWLETRLGEHVTYLKTVPLSHAQLDFASPLKCLHYGDIHKSPRIFLDAARSEMPRAATKLARSAGRLQVGDVIFADASEDPVGVGKSVEVTSVPTSGVVPGLHTIAARFDKDVLADGFKAFLQFVPAFRQALLRLAAGTKVLATTRSYVSSITLSLPPVDEQRAIAGTLTDCEREIEVLRRHLAKARSINQGMMQELLTGRTRLPVEASS